MPIDKVLSTSIAEGAVTASAISNTANLSITSLLTSSNTVTIGTAAYFVGSGSVGIGTSSPDARLQVQGAASTQLILRDTSAYSAGVNGGGILFQGLDSASNNRSLSSIQGIGDGSNSGGLTLSTRSAGSLIERMRIDSSGNVGIGTSSPIAKLDTATTSDNNLNIIRYAESTSGAVFRIRHSYSNTIGTNTLLPGTGGGYQFGRIEFVGATGTDYAVGASIVGIALGSTSSTSMPGVLIFNTTPESSTSPTERARIPAAGGFQCVNSISVGNATPTTSGAGITFPATQSASTDANTLDDYEEGTWTPQIGGQASGTKTAAAGNVGYYTKIGRQVFCWGTLAWNSTDVLSGNIIIKNLPFTSANDRGGGLVGVISSGLSTTAGYTTYQIVVDPTLTSAYIIQVSVTGSGYSHNPTVSNSGTIYGFCFNYST